jgi:hypothetical protein
MVNPKQISGHVEVAGALAAAGRALGIDSSVLLSDYQHFALATQGPIRVETNDRYDRLSIMALRGEMRPEERPVRAEFLEMTALPGDEETRVIDHAIGRELPETDFKTLLDHGVHNEVLTELAKRVRVLSPKLETSGWTHVHRDPTPWRLHVRIDKRDPAGSSKVLELAERIGVTQPQQRLLSRVHPVLSKHRSVLVTLPTAASRLPAAMQVSYPEVEEDNILRLLSGIFPDAPHGKRLGGFVGAIHSRQLPTLTLELGDEEPVGFRFAIEMPAGDGA